jgi:hypothetical protein
MMVDLKIDGRRFEVTVLAPTPLAPWQWMLASPGQVLLVGEAESEQSAFEQARTAGRFLAHTQIVSR